MSDQSESDAKRLQRVCESFLYATRWAGELGDPMPRTHTDRKSKRAVTEIRHERRVCAEIVMSFIELGERSGVSRLGEAAFRALGRLGGRTR